ncbi:MAG: DUF3795 domain-containing protein [bacterium]|nr:DUF3795 domain-containing protein [bacterium]
MTKSLCGIDCDACPMKNDCGGCVATGGKPFGGECVVAKNCAGAGCKNCDECQKISAALKAKVAAEFNALGIKDLPKVETMNELRGAFINLEYKIPGGQRVRFWDDNRIYLGNQIEKKDGRCYGLTADENYLLVCEYDAGGANPEVIVYKKR